MSPEGCSNVAREAVGSGAAEELQDNPERGGPSPPRMPPTRLREAQRAAAAASARARPPSVKPSPPRSPPQLLQSAYDTYAENIHAISVRASSSSALSHYGSAPHSLHRLSGSSFHESESDWRLSLAQTGVHLVSFMAGSGLVFLPLALVDLDWYGVLVLALAGCICLYTAKLLIEAMDILRWSSGRSVTYCDLAKECLGQKGYYLTAVLLHGSFLLSATGYIALVASCITGMTGADYGVVLVFVGLTVWFHVLVKSLKALAVFSAINVGVCFWVEAVIFGDAMYPLKQIALEESAFIFGTPDLTNASLFVKLAYSFSLLASGFFCHSVIPTFYNAMADHRKCSTVVLRSQTAVLGLLYLPVCVVTYAVYGATLQAPVFFNMRNPVVRYLAVVLYCVHLLLSYFVTLYPLQRAIERVLFLANDEQRLLLAPTPAMLGLLNHGDTTYHSDKSPPLEQRRERGLQLLLRTGSVLATVVFAFVFRPTTLAVFAVAIVPATTLSLILPCVFFWTLCTEEAGCLDKLAIVAIIALASVSMVTTVWVIAVSS